MTSEEHGFLVMCAFGYLPGLKYVLDKIVDTCVIFWKAKDLHIVLKVNQI